MLSSSAYAFHHLPSQSFEVRRQRGGGLWSDNFCLFSIRFSDSSDVIAGGANDAHLYIYNIER